MPVEILEIVVRANVQDKPDCGTTNGKQNNAAQLNNAVGNNNADLIYECVSKVLETLRHSQER